MNFALECWKSQLSIYHGNWQTDRRSIENFNFYWHELFLNLRSQYYRYLWAMNYTFSNEPQSVLFSLLQNRRLSNHIHVYNIPNNRWSEIETSSRVRTPVLAGHSATVHKNKMIIFGGLEERARLVIRCYIYSTRYPSSGGLDWNETKKCWGQT